MSTQCKQRRTSTPPAFRSTPIAAACAALLLSAGAQAQAQQAPAARADEEPAKVIVTGIRGSIESAIALKRGADAIVEAITAEDIGKLPDVSIAESIARLPGLTAQRVEGRAQVISIRGLPPDFSTTLMNGREVVSTGENRSVEYDQYPSELISGVTVYKTAEAGLVGQGLAGTVDLLTVKPLDLRGRTIAVNARAEHNSNGALNAGLSGNGKRFSLSYIDQFANNTVGVAVGFAHLDSPGQQLEYKSWWWGNDNKLGDANKDVVGLKGAEVTATSSSQKRDGLMAVFEYRPDKQFRSTVDLYYSEFDKERTMRGMMWNSHQWSDIFYTDPRIETINGTRLLTGGVLHNLKPIVRNDFNTRKDSLFAMGWNNRLRTEGWTLVGDLSYSKADREEQILETYAGLSNNGSVLDTFKFSIPTGAGLPSFTPGLNYADAKIVKLTDPEGWGHDGLMQRPVIKDSLKAVRLSAKRELDSSLFSHVETGLNLSEREKRRTGIENEWNLKNNRAPVTVPAELLLSPTSLSFGGIPSVLAYDIMGTLNRFYEMKPDPNNNLWKRNYTITEKITTLYGKLGIDTAVATLPVRGNLGLQYVHSDQSSVGLNNNGSSSGDAKRGTSYNDLLPSLNLAAELFKDGYLRFGAGRQIARPRMDDLKAGASAGVDGTKLLWNGQGGNPELKPWRANAFDLSFEKYIDKGSYVALAAFYKNLQSYIYNKQFAFDFSGFPNNSAIKPLSNIGTMNMPANGEGGIVKGVEFSGALNLGLLWSAIDGFGISGSISNTKSSIHPNGPGTTQALPGLSGVVSNVSVYYEKYGVSARVSQRYRSAFRGEVTGLFTDRSFSEILPEHQIDLQLGYAFDSGALKNMSVLLQVNNLNDAPYQTRQGDPFSGGAYAPERYTTYGRQVMLGVNYKF
ncbi:TonB-dependent receptor [Massilia sp. TS11]|uniref:TonB-dependent receptor n=1 Tax=Massilia sp. TS11 TaxID=2908003 RepID=UPI001EDBE33F|nr:TonB-dependent receptor [Massilia sp. TS11]MCG2586767.1 TonB-dependent receptor [Massilia sp. TS11]